MTTAPGAFLSVLREWRSCFIRVVSFVFFLAADADAAADPSFFNSSLEPAEGFDFVAEEEEEEPEDEPMLSMSFTVRSYYVVIQEGAV